MKSLLRQISITDGADRRAPIAAWLLPGLAFILCLWLMWPRPFTIPAGDGLTYYSGALHLAEEGRYFHDNDHRPAVPLTRHPPLFSMMWGGLLWLGFSAQSALAIIHAAFLFALGAAGGAVAYHITHSLAGVGLWTMLACVWPGGTNWVYWIRPQTETASAACFVIIIWMLLNAIRHQRPVQDRWLCGGAAICGLSILLKVTGVFSIPAVLLTVWFLHRHHRSSRSAAVLSLLLIVAPAIAWNVRNWMVAGTLESGKISHEVQMIWHLMQITSAEITQWFLPRFIAHPVTHHVHPGLIVGSLIAAVTLLTWYAARAGRTGGLLAGCTAMVAFGTLGFGMVTKFTEETRYWSAMVPTVALLPLVLRLPQRRVPRRIAIAMLACFSLFCFGRFAIARTHLWYGLECGFYAQQGCIAAALLSCLEILRRVLSDASSRMPQTLSRCLGAVVLGALAAGFWRWAHRPAPLIAFMPLLVLGALMVLPVRHLATRCLLCAIPLAASWMLGGWRWIPPERLPQYVYKGVPVATRLDVLQAREFVRSREWPRYFVSNCEEYLVDLFDDHAVLPLPWYRSIARFRAGLPQQPQDDQLVMRDWIRDLRRRRVAEPFVMIMFPRFAARSYYYGPRQLEGLPDLEVEWVKRQDDLHVAICRLSPTATTAAATALEMH